MIARAAFSLYALTVAVLLIVSVGRTEPYSSAGPAFNQTRVPRELPAFRIDKNALSTAANENVMFRGGPERQGQVSEVWPAVGDLHLKFERPMLNLGLHSASKASPIASRGHVFVGADSAMFYAFDEHGRERWSFRVKDSEWGIHATAAADERTVYMGAYNGRLYAFDRETGTAKWVRWLGDALGASPLITEENIYAAIETTGAVNGYVAKMRKSDGGVVWKSRFLGEHPHSSPALSKKHATVIVGANNNHLFAFNDSDGSSRWQVNFPGPIKSTPAIHEDTVFATSWGGGLKAVRIDTGEVLWSVALDDDSQTSPVLLQDMGLVIVAVDTGWWSAHDMKTGKIKWKRRLFTEKFAGLTGSATAQKFKTAAGVNEWRLWLPCGEKKLCLIRASSGDLVKFWDLPAPLSGAPAVLGQDLWLALEGPLQVYNWR